MKSRISLSILFVCALWLECGAQEENPAVTRFREYLRINTAHPVPDYASAIEWLRSQAEEIGLDFKLEEYGGPPGPDGMFAVLMTWNGSDLSLSSILMDSHMDVVAVDPDKWTHPPFEAFKDSEGTIFARGAVDMKPTTMATLESIRRMKASGFVPLRSLHVAVLPDEELYSRGVKAFVNSSTFTSLNVGFAMDEALYSGPESDDMWIVYAEKSVWQFNYTVRGQNAHSSTLPEMTAGQKIQKVIDRLMEYRQTQVDLLNGGTHTMENVTSLNLVKLGGGLGNNIIPDELWASFDMRIITKPGWNLSDVENMLDSIALESGNDTTIDYLVKAMDSAQTPTDDSNPWWLILQQSCQQLNTSCSPHIPNGVTDGRYIRNTGIPLLGINPFPFTAPTAHQVDENINEKNFLKGIERFQIIIQNFLSAV